MECVVKVVPAHVTALTKTKVALMGMPDSVYIGTVCFSMDIIWDEKIPVAATNGKYIKLNPTYWMSLSPAQRLGLYLHEGWHPALLHMIRRGSRDPHRWNIANDHYINLMLLEQGHELPEGGYHDPQYQGLSSDQIYDLLPQQECKESLQDLVEGADNLPLSEVEVKELEDMVIRAALQSKQSDDKPGTVPGVVQVFLDSLQKPKLPAKRLLAKYMTVLDKIELDYRKFNRRYLPQWYLPGKGGNSLTDIAFAVDTSGSVGQKEFDCGYAEVSGIIKTFRPKKISLIHFDTEIKGVDVLTSMKDLMDVKFTGRGGTDIGPVLAWVNENRPKVILIFTDGEFYFNNPVKPKKTEVIWLIHGGRPFNPPFGKVIPYPLEER